MATNGTAALEADSPRVPTPLLWGGFAVFWAVDMITAIRIFLVSNVTELNPITVLFHLLLGLPGVVLVATCYAGFVIVGVHWLPTPYDRNLLLGVTVLYTAFAVHNVSLLVWGVSLLGIYTLAWVAPLLAAAVSVLEPDESSRALDSLFRFRSVNPLVMYLYGAVLFALWAAAVDSAGNSFALAAGSHLLVTYLPPYSAPQVFGQLAIGVMTVVTYKHISRSGRRTRAVQRY